MATFPGMLMPSIIANLLRVGFAMPALRDRHFQLRHERGILPGVQTLRLRQRNKMRRETLGWVVNSSVSSSA